MRTIDCSLALICVFCIVGLSLGLCDFQIVEPVSCGEGVCEHLPSSNCLPCFFYLTDKGQSTSHDIA